MPSPGPATALGAYASQVGAVADLTAAQRHGLVAGILLLHLVGLWALLQVNAVREAVLQAAPIFVSLLAPPTPPAPLPPVVKPPEPALKRLVRPLPLPLPAPVIAAPPTLTPTAKPFVVPVAPPPLPQITAPTAPAPPVVAETPAAAQPPAPKLLPDSAVQYLQAPEVVYPRLSQRHAETGLVIVRAYIGASGGAPHSVQIERTSGHARLDQAALAAVHGARFKPYAEKGQPVEGWALIPIRFELEK